MRNCGKVHLRPAIRLKDEFPTIGAQSTTYRVDEQMGVFKARIIGVAGIALGLFLACAGCSLREGAARQSPPRFVKMQAKLDYSEHEPYAQPGENSISGQALLKQQANRTCSGNRVLLLPATSYFREMIGHMVAGSEPKPPATPYPSLKNMIRRAQCDEQGKFLFSGIPDGAWFILTQVNARNGGVLITEMTVSNRETKDILLTDKHLVGR